MSDVLVKSELINKILHLTLNNQTDQNTLSEQMIGELDNKFKEASNDNKVKVIITMSFNNNLGINSYYFYVCKWSDIVIN